MTNLIPAASFDDVIQHATSDLVLAGPGGPMNMQAQQLLNRTQFIEQARQLMAIDIASLLQFDSDLVNPTDISKGAAKVGYRSRDVRQKLDDEKSVLDFGPVDTLANRTATFQAALNSASNLYIPPGNWAIGRITIPNTVKRFRGAGSATILTLSGSSPALTPFIFGNTNTDLDIGSFDVNVDHAVYTTTQAIQIGAGIRGKVSDIHFIDGGWIGLYMPGCNGVIVEDITADTFGQSMFLADNNPGELNIRTLRTPHKGTGHTISVVGGSGHTVSYCKVRGGGADFFGISLYQSFSSTISMNTVSATHREGVQMTDGDGNICVDNRVFCEAGHNDFGISIFSDGANLKNNVVSRNIVVQSGASGIGISASYTPVARICQLNTVSDNFIINPNQIDDAYGAGILLLGGSGCTGNTIQNNTCVDESNKMRYGVNEWNSGGNPNNNRLINNNCFGGAVFSSEGNIVGSLSEVYDLRPFTHIPTITSSTGAITTASGSIKYRRQGKFVQAVGSIVITTNGTGAGTLIITHPFGGIISGVINGRAHVVSNKQLQCSVNGVGTMAIRNYDGTYPAASGETLMLSGIIGIP